MALSPLGGRRRLRRVEHGPAAVSRGVDSRLPRRVALALTHARYVLSKEFGEALFHLRAELRAELGEEREARRAELGEEREARRAELGEEREARRGREGGLSRLLREHTGQISDLADRIAALEGDPGPDSDTAAPARLRVVPAPRPTGIREAS